VANRSPSLTVKRTAGCEIFRSSPEIFLRGYAPGDNKMKRIRGADYRMGGI